MGVYIILSTSSSFFIPFLQMMCVLNFVCFRSAIQYFIVCVYVGMTSCYSVYLSYPKNIHMVLLHII